MTHPQAIEPLLTLATELRQHGFSIAPDQTIGFIEAVGVLGPREIGDIHRAAIALFAIPPERRFEFDAIFKKLFLGLQIAAQADGSDDEVDAFEPTGGEEVVETGESQEPAGSEAVMQERLQSREISLPAEDQVLIDFERRAKSRLPHRQSYRWARVQRGEKLDLRRTLRAAAKRDGEIIDLAVMRRKKRQRRVLLLIDVSGSMKELTSSSLRFAHSLLCVADSAEVFTLGTRLTRVTSALQLKDRDIAMQRVSQLVADFDGGTRIGNALQAYLAVPKYAGFARGAAVIVLSDGLERGDADLMVDATVRLSRIAWQLSWLTPLAADVDFQPETEALKRVLPHINVLGAGHTVSSMCNHVLEMASA